MFVWHAAQCPRGLTTCVGVVGKRGGSVGAAEAPLRTPWCPETPACQHALAVTMLNQYSEQRPMMGVMWKGIAIFLLGAVSVSCSFQDPSEKAHVQYEDVVLNEVDKAADEASLSTRTVTVEPVTLADEPAPSPEYLVGPYDELAININGEPSMDSLVARVDSSGFIQLPLINRLNVSGKSLLEIQQDLIEAYSREFRDPWVLTSISAYKSQPVYLLGELQSPGVYSLERPTNIMQALGIAGGMTPNAFLQRARLIREEKIVAIDIEALLNKGQLDQNIWLKPEDTIYVPGIDDLTIFVLGAVNDPGEYPFQRGISALAAVSAAGDIVRGAARLDDARIVRTLSPVKGELITVDIASILRGDRPDFPLAPGDIVFIPQTILGGWNDVISQISPTFSVASSVLEPFVQIEFLEEQAQ